MNKMNKHFSARALVQVECGPYFVTLFVTFFNHYSLMSAATVLVKAAWPDDPLERVIFGEAEVACLCRQVVFTGTQSAEVVLTCPCTSSAKQ